MLPALAEKRVRVCVKLSTISNMYVIHQAAKTDPVISTSNIDKVCVCGGGVDFCLFLPLPSRLPHAWV